MLWVMVGVGRFIVDGDGWWWVYVGWWWVVMGLFWVISVVVGLFWVRVGGGHGGEYILGGGTW